MSHRQLQEKKKRERVKKSKNKVVARRAAIAREREKELAQSESYEKEFLQRREDPTLTPEARAALLEKITKKAVKNLTPEESKERDDALVARMKKNIEYLEGLEKQMIEEKEAKERTAKILETSGAVTLEEKMQTLHESQKKNGNVIIGG